MSKEQKILSIATDVRKWAEDYASKNGFNSNLRGVCAIASAELHKRLKVEGIDTLIHVAESDSGRNCHVFLTVGNKILDVTATQFSKETFYKVTDEVVLAPKKKYFKYWFWQSEKSFSTATDLVQQQLADNWYPNQVAKA